MKHGWLHKYNGSARRENVLRHRVLKGRKIIDRA